VALVLCVLGVSCSQKPLLFSELDSQTRELALYGLDSVAMSRFDAKLVARLPNVPAAGETACNGNTCFVLPLNSALGVVYAINVASGNVRYFATPPPQSALNSFLFLKIFGRTSCWAYPAYLRGCDRGTLLRGVRWAKHGGRGRGE
jgi:hypothetical protein